MASLFASLALTLSSALPPNPLRTQGASRAIPSICLRKFHAKINGNIGPASPDSWRRGRPCVPQGHSPESCWQRRGGQRRTRSHGRRRRGRGDDCGTSPCAAALAIRGASRFAPRGSVPATHDRGRDAGGNRGCGVRVCSSLGQDAASESCSCVNSVSDVSSGDAGEICRCLLYHSLRIAAHIVQQLELELE